MMIKRCLQCEKKLVYQEWVDPKLVMFCNLSHMKKYFRYYMMKLLPKEGMK